MLRKLFNLYPGEGKTASLFLLLGFLWSLGAFGGLTLSEGMFIEQVGAASLPLSYLITACSMCLFSALLLFALNRLSISWLLGAIIIGAVACDSILYFLLGSNVQGIWLWYLFKGIGWILPTAIYICFWAFIDQYYDLQDAKRCFCLFNAVLYLGDAVAGGLISFSIESLGPHGLTLIFLTAIGSTLPLIYFITKRIKPVSEESVDGNPPQKTLHLPSIFRLILTSPFTLILLLFYFVMQLIVITTEYNYMDAFEKTVALAPHTHTLTEFLGMLAMWVSLGNLVFGLFFYSRTVTRFGVNNLILIGPLFFTLIFGCWVSKELFAIALCAFIAREGMIYTFDDNNLLLLISGVPTKIKNQVRIAIESFFEPVGMIFGATLLLLFQTQSKELGLLLCSLVCVVVFFLRSHYPKAIFQNVVAHAIHFEKKASERLKLLSKKEKKKVEMNLLAHLKKGDEETKLLAFEYLLKLENPSFLVRLLNLFDRLTIRGKLKVIELLNHSSLAKEPLVIERLGIWRKLTAHPSIRSSIHLYLARHHLMKKELVINDLESPHLSLQTAAILALKTSSETLSSSLRALEKLNCLLQSDSEEEVASALLVLGYEKRKENIRDLLSYLNSPSPLVNRAAAQAIYLCSDPTFTEYSQDLIAHLGQTTDSQVRYFCLKALEKTQDSSTFVTLICSAATFKNSESKLVETICASAQTEDLLELIKEEALPISSRLLAGKILGKRSARVLKVHQFNLILKEVQRATFYLYHAEMIKNEEKDHDLLILKNALETTFRSILDFIIQLSTLSGSLEVGAFEGSEILSRSLHSKNRKVRAHTLETLEKAIDPTIFSLLKPLMDERRFQERLKMYQKLGIKPVTLTELLETLQRSPSVANQIVSLTLQARLKLPNWQEALKERLENGEKIFHHFAHELLASGQS